MQRWQQVRHLWANGAASYSIIINPYKCTLKNVVAMVAVDPGDSDTLTITAVGGSETLGVYTYGTTLAAGSTGTWVADTTNGDHVLTALEGILITGSNGAAAGVSTILVEFDPHALTKDTFND